MPAYWVKFAPRLTDSLEGSTPRSRMFCVHDSSNAYHSVLIDEDSKMRCVSKIRDNMGNVIYVQAVGGDQGLAVMALFYPVWSGFGYTHFLGPAFELLWRNFVDDTLCWGDGDTVAETAAEAELKMFILGIIKELMGLKVSLKQDINVYAEVEFCGLWWSAAGICIGEEGVK